jgi:hypothetical protein
MAFQAIACSLILIFDMPEKAIGDQRDRKIGG